jgi:hypothetical protein
MKGVLLAAVVTAIGVGLAGGYLLGRGDRGRPPTSHALASLDPPSGAERDRAWPSPAPAPAAAPSTPVSAPMVAEPISLPSTGALDRLLLQEGATHAQTFIRNQVVTTLVPLIKRACGPLHQVGDSRVDVRVDVTIKNGDVILARVSDVVVARGAPLSPAAEACVRNLLPSPRRLPKPPPAADAPAYARDQYTGRWSGVPDFEGDVLVIVNFNDKCEVPESAIRPKRRSDR